MKPNVALASLRPELYPAGAAFKDACGVSFECPGCHGTKRAHRVAMSFSQWKQVGADLEHLTFVDAVGEPNGQGGTFSTRSYRRLGTPCRSHFNITNGVIDHYGDSESP